jgi:hypothetical protein
VPNNIDPLGPQRTNLTVLQGEDVRAFNVMTHAYIHNIWGLMQHRVHASIVFNPNLVKLALYSQLNRTINTFEVSWPWPTFFFLRPFCTSFVKSNISSVPASHIRCCPACFAFSSICTVQLYIFPPRGSRLPILGCAMACSNYSFPTLFQGSDINTHCLALQQKLQSLS